MYAPIIKSARRVREHVLGQNHTAVLMTDIESDHDQGAAIDYTYLLVVFDRRHCDPIAFISAEKASPTEASAITTPASKWKELGLDEGEFGISPATGSHFLCAFLPFGHSNYGSSDDWANIDKFECAALELVKRLGLTEEPPDRMARKFE